MKMCLYCGHKMWLAFHQLKLVRSDARILYPLVNTVFQDYKPKGFSTYRNIWINRPAFLCTSQSNQTKRYQTHHLFYRQRFLFLQELNETRSKMQERMGEIIERENIFTIPNILCAARIVFSPLIGYFILKANFDTAFYLTAFAGVTDLLDGAIARNFKSQASKLGSFLDPMADKILIATTFISLTYIHLIPVLLTSLIIVRDLMLAGAGVWIRYKSLPPPRTLSRYFDASHATAQLAPTFISKVNTVVQLLAVAVTLAAPVMDFVGHPFVFYLWCLTGGTTVASGVSYMLSNNTYKLLRGNGKL